MRGRLLYWKPQSRDPKKRKRRSKKYYLFHELDGHTTDECMYLRDIIEEHVKDDRLPRYTRTRAAAVE